MESSGRTDLIKPSSSRGPLAYSDSQEGRTGGQQQLVPGPAESLHTYQADMGLNGFCAVPVGSRTAAELLAGLASQTDGPGIAAPARQPKGGARLCNGGGMVPPSATVEGNQAGALAQAPRGCCPPVNGVSGQTGGPAHPLTGRDRTAYENRSLVMRRINGDLKVKQAQQQKRRGGENRDIGSEMLNGHMVGSPGLESSTDQVLASGELDFKRRKLADGTASNNSSEAYRLGRAVAPLTVAVGCGKGSRSNGSLALATPNTNHHKALSVSNR